MPATSLLESARGRTIRLLCWTCPAGDAFTVDGDSFCCALTYCLSGRVVCQRIRSTSYVRSDIALSPCELVAADVAAAMRRIGADRGRGGGKRCRAIRGGVRRADEAHRGSAAISVFFQISARPLFTVNREHFISEIIALCGGRGIFDDLGELAPSVDVEAVLDRDPEIILAGANVGDEAFAVWERWPQLAANRLGNQYLLPDETIGRPSPRLTMAGRAVCLALEQGRRNRDATL